MTRHDVEVLGTAAGIGFYRPLQGIGLNAQGRLSGFFARVTRGLLPRLAHKSRALKGGRHTPHEPSSPPPPPQVPDSTTPPTEPSFHMQANASFNPGAKWIHRCLGCLPYRAGKLFGTQGPCHMVFGSSAQEWPRAQASRRAGCLGFRACWSRGESCQFCSRVKPFTCRNTSTSRTQLLHSTTKTKDMQLSSWVCLLP